MRRDVLTPESFPRTCGMISAGTQAFVAKLVELLTTPARRPLGSILATGTFAIAVVWQEPWLTVWRVRSRTFRRLSRVTKEKKRKLSDVVGSRLLSEGRIHLRQKFF